jgi:hypothetical protein
MELQRSKSPVMLINTKESEDGDLIFNQRSAARSAPNSDVGFDYTESSEASTSKLSDPLYISTTITLDMVLTLRQNQKVTVVGTVSLGSEAPKEVTIRAKDVLVKEDCILEDQTGSASLHMWDRFIDQVTNAKSYRLENLVVKSFQGNVYLSTTFSSSITEVEQVVDTLIGPELLESKERKVTVEEFKLVKKLDIFVACQSCNRKVDDVSEKFMKCKNCDSRQRRSSCPTQASVQVQVELPESESLWLTAFTDTLEQLLRPATSVMLSSSSSDKIEETLLTVKNIKFVYNMISNVITSILDVSL